MHYVEFVPLLLLLGTIALIMIIVPACVEISERRRIARMAPRPAKLRLVLIEGGKMRQPPAAEDDALESRIA